MTLSELNPEALVADGFDTACIVIQHPASARPGAVFDRAGASRSWLSRAGMAATDQA